jgi:hypothetical protein
MTYEQYVLEVFRDHNDCIGVSVEETDDLINESTFAKIERWLIKQGYNLSEMYENDK